MKNLTLYSANPSRGLMNQWLLAELGVEYELRLLDLEAEEHKTVEYLAVNPMGKVPALVHGNAIVTESAAINFYLAEQFPESGLSVSVDSVSRAEYLRWCFYAPITIEPAVLSAAFDLKHPEYQPFADIETVAETLRQRLGQNEFMVGDTFTAADIAIGSAIFWGLNLMPVMPRYNELIDYWARLEQRPAWQSLQNN